MSRLKVPAEMANLFFHAGSSIRRSAADDRADLWGWRCPCGGEGACLHPSRETAQIELDYHVYAEHGERP